MRKLMFLSTLKEVTARNCPIVKEIGIKGRGSGQVVGLYAFYSNDPSSNPSEVL